jgi:Cu/Ag efflux protein CusF
LALTLEGVMLRLIAAVLIVTQALLLMSTANAVNAMEERKVAQATGAKEEKSTAPAGETQGKEAVRSVRLSGTVAAIDKDKGTVTLKGPKGRTVTLDVKDKAKLDAIKVGDPVVATYMEAIAVQLAKAGGSPGVTTQETRVSSKPGETPAGAIGRQVTVTATIVAIDKKAHTVTIKGPEGRTETVKAKDPKNLDQGR